MKIEKHKWQEWAAMFADQEVNDFTSKVPMTIEQAIILRAKIESAALYGMELAATLAGQGADVSEAKETQAALLRAGARA